MSMAKAKVMAKALASLYQSVTQAENNYYDSLPVKSRRKAWHIKLDVYKSIVDREAEKVSDYEKYCKIGQLRKAADLPFVAARLACTGQSKVKRQSATRETVSMEFSKTANALSAAVRQLDSAWRVWQSLVKKTRGTIKSHEGIVRASWWQERKMVRKARHAYEKLSNKVKCLCRRAQELIKILNRLDRK